MAMTTNTAHPSDLAARPSAVDPVCGMSVTEQSPHQLTHEGQPYYFCSAKCQDTFAANPGPYAAPARPAQPAPPASAAGTIYTCPMHPEVRQDHPGNYPRCGMTPEPVRPDLDDDNPELRDFQRRFWWTLIGLGTGAAFVYSVVAMVGNMKQNLRVAFLYNPMGIPIAAGVLYPLTGWLLSPIIAALAMRFSSVSVIGNALRLRRARE